MRCVTLPLFLVSIACNGGRERAPQAQGETPPATVTQGAIADDGAPSPDDAMFVIARPAIERVPKPRWTSAPLPASLADLEGDAVPPRPYLAAALRHGTVRMRERFVDAVTRAANAGPLPERLASWYSQAFGYTRDANICAWIAETATGKAPAAARAVFWQTLSRCHDLASAAVLERDDAPDQVIVDWYFEQIPRPQLPFRERVARAAAEIARTSEQEYEQRKVGFVFATMTGAESIAAITNLQKSIADPERRARIAIGMMASASPAGLAIGRRACSHRVLSDDTMCRGRATTSRAAPKDVASLLRDGEPVEALLAKFARPTVLAALAACARAGEIYDRADCLGSLAALDRPAAVAIAREASASTGPSHRLADVIGTLLRFPEPGALEAELSRLGLTPGHAQTRERAPITVAEVLAARGRLTSFDTETGQFPNEHDELLAELAALATPALDDVVFEEIPPPQRENDEGPYYTLHAYAGGKRYTVIANNYGDWYDVDASIGLVNALLIARRSPLRLAALYTGDQTATVLAAPASGIRALRDTKLIELAKASDSMRAGKEFEDRVFESLGSGAQRDVRLPRP